jgi:hypothetical protein
MHIYDKADKARDHFERFVTIIDNLRDEVLEEDYNVRDGYGEVSDILAFLDEETQPVWTKVNALVREVKRANT